MSENTNQNQPQNDVPVRELKPRYEETLNETYLGAIKNVILGNTTLAENAVLKESVRLRKGLGIGRAAAKSVGIQPNHVVNKAYFEVLLDQSQISVSDLPEDYEGKEGEGWRIESNGVSGYLVNRTETFDVEVGSGDVPKILEKVGSIAYKPVPKVKVNDEEKEAKRLEREKIKAEKAAEKEAKRLERVAAQKAKAEEKAKAKAEKSAQKSTKTVDKTQPVNEKEPAEKGSVKVEKVVSQNPQSNYPKGTLFEIVETRNEGDEPILDTLSPDIQIPVGAIYYKSILGGDFDSRESVEAFEIINEDRLQQLRQQHGSKLLRLKPLVA